MVFSFNRIGIVGIGLMGGSLGKACKRLGLAKEVIGYGKNIKKLATALESNIVDKIFPLAELFQQGQLESLDLLILATPVNAVKDILKKIFALGYKFNNLTITDVGSTKKEICQFARYNSGGDIFVGSHPMAGMEKSGLQFSEANLYKDATVFICPSGLSRHTEKVSSFWQAVGGNISLVNPELHDHIVAKTSHIPHILAAAFISQLGKESKINVEIFNKKKKWFGKGLLDFTRIVEGSAEMWSDIIEQNSEEIQRSLTEYINELKMVQQMIKKAQPKKIFSYLESSASLRQSLNDNNIS